MKRTAVTVCCGLAASAVAAALVFGQRELARIEAQQARLGARQTQVDALEQELALALADGEATRRELDALREQVVGETEVRIASLERRLAAAAAGTEQARALASELARAKHGVERFHSQMSTDFERTKELVDAYMCEVRAKEASAAHELTEARGQIATLASTIYQDRDELTRRMLLPTVQLNGEDTVGSGTIVFSGPNPQRGGAVESYVLTSYHVVRNILADAPRARREGFDVTVYLPEEDLVVTGEMIASDPTIDAALVQLDTQRVLPNVANVLPRGEVAQVRVWDPVCAVGCPLGNDPVPSKGEVSSLHNELNGANYWMVNAPTYFGNSGGGIYRADTKQLIGVFSKIYTHGQGRPVVVPHMGLCTPMDLIYGWLESHDLEHLLCSERVTRVDLRQLAAPAK